MAHKLASFLIEHIIGVGLFFVGLFTLRGIWHRESEGKKARNKIAQQIKNANYEPLTLHPEIDPALCAGCGACTKVCPEGDILKMVDGKAKLVTPSKCVGHGECERACPFSAISLVFGTKTRGMDIPRLTGNYETNVPGLYIAGELGGMGLIRNATKQGALAARHALQKLPPAKTDVDLAIVGAGPAGLTAALCAVEAKKTYVLLEQNKFGGTIANFPRQKVVMSHPFELPIFGVAKFNSNRVSKAELLDYWEQVRSQVALKVREQTRFTGAKKEGQIFTVSTSDGSFTAKKVILTMGVRGTPRKLGVPGEELNKVAYNLLEADQYVGMKVIVVGGGNAAVEAAQMLAQAKRKCKVHLLVRGPTFDRCNDENKAKIDAMAAKQLLQIWFNSELVKIEQEKVTVRKNGSDADLENDQVFIFAGADIPSKFLMSLGIKIDKKFGEGLRQAR